MLCCAVLCVALLEATGAGCGKAADWAMCGELILCRGCLLCFVIEPMPLRGVENSTIHCTCAGLVLASSFNLDVVHVAARVCFDRQSSGVFWCVVRVCFDGAAIRGGVGSRVTALSGVGNGLMGRREPSHCFTVVRVGAQ